ncbi:4812_t:CDS:2, partial [Ambispora gerdemannii]
LEIFNPTKSTSSSSITKVTTEFTTEVTTESTTEVITESMTKESAESGLIDAQLLYGHMIWNGYNVKRNVEEAIKYYKLTADNGNIKAMFNIGQIYWYRNGSEEEKQQGEEYLRKALYKGLIASIEFCNISGIQL